MNTFLNSRTYYFGKVLRGPQHFEKNLPLPSNVKYNGIFFVQYKKVNIGGVIANKNIFEALKYIEDCRFSV